MIYLNLDKQPSSIAELLTELFSVAEYFSPNYYKGVATYSDIRCEILQCGKGKLRSIDEVLEIILTYFPNTEIKTAFKEILDLRIGNKKLYPSNCMDIRKSVMGYYKFCDVTYYHFDTPNYDFSHNQKYNWKHFREILGFKSNEGIIYYLKTTQ